MVHSKVKQIAEDIQKMKTRGAGRIGRAAARALKITAKSTRAKTPSQFMKEIDRVTQLLLKTRPTAVSLPNAIRFVARRSSLEGIEDVRELREIVSSRADEFTCISREAVKKIGEFGARRVSDGDVIVTHCNSSCALSVIKTAHQQGKNLKVFVTESRPREQGVISARSLSKAGIKTTLIVDSAARFFMKDVDKVIVGADSIAANGAVVNKIGTAPLALAAHEARVVVLVAAESYKFHPQTLVGELVEIEERDPKEILGAKKLSGVEIRNPAFDVTPPEYIDLIITERGIIPPQAAYTVLQEQFEWKPGEETLRGS